MLDSTSLIDYERRKPEAVAGIRRLRQEGGLLGSCTITVAEFYSGRLRGTDPSIDAFIDGLIYWEIEYEDALQAGEYRWRFARRGIQLTATDTLIAAVAARTGAIILTENIKDFPMEGVRVESLTARSN